MDIDRIRSRLNPALLWVLCSPLHRLLSSQLMALHLTGRRTGRRYSIPVGYQRNGETITILVSKARDKKWWHNFLEHGAVEVTVRGSRRHGEARVLAIDGPEFRDAFELLLSRLPSLASRFGITYDSQQGLGEEQLAILGRENAAVRIALEPQEGESGGEARS